MDRRLQLKRTVRSSIRFRLDIMAILVGFAMTGNVYPQGGFAAFTNGGMNDFSKPYLDEKYGLELGVSVFGNSRAKYALTLYG